jgi:hypothetical protein
MVAAKEMFYGFWLQLATRTEGRSILVFWPGTYYSKSRESAIQEFDPEGSLAIMDTVDVKAGTKARRGEFTAFIEVNICGEWEPALGQTSLCDLTDLIPKGFFENSCRIPTSRFSVLM